jgi:hypothetical protein
MPGLYDISSNVANVAVSNTPGLYIGGGASSILNNAQQLLALLSNQGNVNFSLASGNTTVQGFFVGNTSVYSNANVAAYLPINSSNVAGAYFIGNGSKLTNLPQQAGTYTNANVAAFLPTYDGNIGQPAQRPSYVYSSFFVGDGSGLTNLPSTSTYGNANVAAFLPVNTSNVAATYFLGDGSLLTNLPIPGVYGNANVAAYLLTNTGNISAGYFIGDGSQLTNLPDTSNYGNANVAVFLPTYTGTLDNSSTVVALFANAAAQSLDISTLFGSVDTLANAQAAANVNISTTQANLGAFQTYANTTFGTSNYGNANVAAYLPTYTGMLDNSSTIINLVANAATQAAAINAIDANLGTATTNIATLFSNAAAQAAAINTIDANLGTATNNITTLFTNAATQATSINTLNANVGTLFLGNASTNANLGAFQTYANATFSTGGGSSYGNANVAAYLPAYGGNIGNVGITSGDRYLYGGNINIVSNTAWPTGGRINFTTNRTNGAGQFGFIGLNSNQVEIGYNAGNPATSLVRIKGPVEFDGTVATNANLYAFTQGNVIIVNDNNEGGNRTNFGGYLFVANTITAGSNMIVGGNVSAAYTNTTGVNTTTAAVTGQFSAGNITTASGLFWANGTNFVNSIYSNVNVGQFLPSYLGDIGNVGMITNTRSIYSGNVNIFSNPGPSHPDVLYTGIYLSAANANSTSGGQITLNSEKISVGVAETIGAADSYIYLRANTRITGQNSGQNTGNVLTVLNGNVRIGNTNDFSSGAPVSTNFGGYLYVANLISTGGRVTAGNVSSTNGYFWSNGTPYTTGTYGNAQVLANLAANSTQTTAWSIPFGGNAARPSAAFAGMIRYNTDYNVPEWYSNVNAAWYSFSNPVNIAPPAGTSMWYLAVGGGAAGGSRIGAGGGAGGLLIGNVSISAGTTYTITVGAGGAAVTSIPGVVGNDGGNTTITGSGFSTITAIGGGGGGAYIGTSGTAGRNGASGGGGSYSGNGGVNTPGSGTSGQGSTGGAGSATNVSGGGGGGASAVGEAAQASRGGNGGAGTASTITGASVTYAGGGGGSQATTGGTGGTGGGGNGSSGNSNGAAGTNFLGGGGGGARNDSDTSNVNSGKGGDGVVIIRVANVSYSGSYTGSNVAISYAGGDTILKFSASGTYTG